MAELNVVAVVDMTGRLLPEMVARGRGAVLNVASSAAFQPLPRQATYAATKAFVLSFTDALHLRPLRHRRQRHRAVPGPRQDRVRRDRRAGRGRGRRALVHVDHRRVQRRAGREGRRVRQAGGGAGPVQRRRRARRPARPARAAAQGARADHPRRRSEAARRCWSPAAALAGCGGEDEDERPAPAPPPPRAETDPGHPDGQAPERADGGPRVQTVADRAGGALGHRLPARRPGAGDRAPGPRAPAGRRRQAPRPSRSPRSRWTTRARAACSALVVDPRLRAQRLRLPVPHHRRAATRSPATG